LFQYLASGLISPKIKINLGKEASKAAHDFTATVALMYMLSTSMVTLLDLNGDLPGLN
jgi:hypothetical protein